MPEATILVVDDEALIRWSLTERLHAEGYDVLEAGTGQAALEKLQEGVDLVLLDYRLPDTDGVSVLRRIKDFDQDVLVILLTAYASVETAVEAMKHGAYHFANKPFNLDEVSAAVERALETTRLRREVRQYRTNAARPYSLQRLVGASQSIKALRALIARVAGSPASTVLLTGESGTGKDLAAKIRRLLEGTPDDRTAENRNECSRASAGKSTARGSSRRPRQIWSPATDGRSPAMTRANTHSGSQPFDHLASRSSSLLPTHHAAAVVRPNFSIR